MREITLHEEVQGLVKEEGEPLEKILDDEPLID